MTEAIKFEESSGNVFADIGFSEDETERELLRSDLAFEIYGILEERKLGKCSASIRMMYHDRRTANFNVLVRSVFSYF